MGIQLKRLALITAVLGAAIILGAFVLNSYNVGSCPAILYPQMYASCDHTMTIAGVSFWIGATALRMAVVGAIVLAFSGVVFLIFWMKQTKPAS